MQTSPRRIALIGSSGGGAATLSAENTASSAIATLKEQLALAGMQLSAVQFVECKIPLDLAKDSDHASLWMLQEGDLDKVECVAEGSLSSVNKKAAGADAWLAEQVMQGNLDGVIMVSISIFEGPEGVCGVNAKTLCAIVEKQLPCVGTGGTGIGRAYSLGANLISGGGSVCTTTLTRSIAFTSAFAAHWGLPYSLGTGFIVPQLHSALDGCLPIFMGLYVFVGLQRQSIIKQWLGTDPPSRAVNVVVTTVTAHEVAKLGSIGMVAGAAAAGCLHNSSVPSDMLVGISCGILLRLLLPLCFRFGLPATAASIVACGLSGLTAGLLGKHIACESLASSSHMLLSALDDFLADHFVMATLMGALFGCSMFWGSQHGLYHVLFLPLILLEMQYVSDEKLGGGSLLGTLDEAVLAVMSAGTLLAVMLQSQSPQERKAARRGFWVNFAWGDFIEAGYPYMQGTLMQVACYLCSAASGSVIFTMRVRSSAYLPLPAAVLLSNRPFYAAAAFNIVFVGIFIARMSIGIMKQRTLKSS